MRHSAGTCHLPIISGLFLGAVCASAEVIHLKNGRTIYADQVHENGSHLEYEVGEDSYAIPKSAVDRVEAGGIRPERASTRAARNPRTSPHLLLPTS